MDELSLHLYPGSAADGIAWSLTLLRKVEAAVPDVPINVDEFGWQSRPQPDKAALYTGGDTIRRTSEQRQARIYADLILALRADPRVRSALVYLLTDEVDLRTGWQSGLLRPDHSHKPAFEAIRAAIGA